MLDYLPVRCYGQTNHNRKLLFPDALPLPPVLYFLYVYLHGMEL